MTTPRCDNAGRQPGEVGTAKQSKNKIITKLDRVIDLLKTRPEGLNRFEAEQYGEHCLNSTVAEIRSVYGNKLVQRWEVVPTRYSPNGVRCCRYWLTGGGSQ